MHDAFAVGGIEGVRQLSADVEKTIKRKGVAGQLGVEALSLDQFHGDEGLLAIFFHRVDGADVRMIQSGGRASFEKETIQSGGLTRDIWRQKFQATRRPRLRSCAS